MRWTSLKLAALELIQGREHGEEAAAPRSKTQTGNGKVIGQNMHEEKGKDHIANHGNQSSTENRLLIAIQGKNLADVGVDGTHQDADGAGAQIDACLRCHSRSFRAAEQIGQLRRQQLADGDEEQAQRYGARKAERIGLLQFVAVAASGIDGHFNAGAIDHGLGKRLENADCGQADRYRRNGLLADDCARKERVHHQGDAYGEGGCKARGIHPQNGLADQLIAFMKIACKHSVFNPLLFI